MSKTYTNNDEFLQDIKKSINDDYFSWLDQITKINSSLTDEGVFITTKDKIPLGNQDKKNAELLFALFKEIFIFHKMQLNPNAIKKSLGDYWPCFFIKHNNIGYIIGKLQNINEQSHIKIRRMTDEEFRKINPYKFIDIHQLQEFFYGKRDFQIPKIDEPQKQKKLILSNPKYKR